MNVLVQRGTAYFFKKQPNRALSDLNQAIRVDSSSLQAYKLRGAIHSGSGWRDPAVEALGQAVRIDPLDVDARVLLGTAYTYLGDYKRPPMPIGRLCG